MKISYKTIIAFCLVALASLLLMACGVTNTLNYDAAGTGSLGQQEPVAELENVVHENTQESEQESVIASEYTALSFTGVLRRLEQDGVASRIDVWSDKAFVDKVWSALDYSLWLAYDGHVEDISQSQNLINLSFYEKADDPFRLTIGSDDIGSSNLGWSGLEYSGEYDISYYVLPVGTYERVKNLLTDFCAEYSNVAIDIEGLRDFSVNGVIRFALSEEPVHIVELRIEDDRDLAAEWELELWQPYIAHGDVDGPTAAIIRGVEFESTVGIDRVHIATCIISDVHVVVISNNLGVINYMIPESTYQTIARQYESFKAEYYGKQSKQNSPFAEYIAQGYEIEAALGVVALIHPEFGWDEANVDKFTAKFDENGSLTIATNGFNVFREVKGMTREEINDLISLISREADYGVPHTPEG